MPRARSQIGSMSTEKTVLETSAAADAELQPSDYATGFVQGWLRAQGVNIPSVPEFREALAELSEHLKEIRHHAH